MIEETNRTLQKFMEVSIKQFEWQHHVAEDQSISNKRQEAFNERQEAFNKSQLASNERQEIFNERTLSFAERQQSFNEQFLAKLDEISNKL